VVAGNIRRVADAAAASAVLAGPLLAACGSAHPPATAGGANGTATAPASPRPLVPATATIVADMKASAEKATSVHINGSVLTGGQLAKLDMTFAGTSSLAGSVSQAGHAMGLIVAGGQDYVKINKYFLSLAKIPGSACTAVCGEYLAVPASQASSLSGDLSMPTMIKQMVSFTSADIAALTFTPWQYDGQAAYTATADGASIVVERSAGYLPLALTDGTKVSVVFSDWNTAAVPLRPSASKLVTAAEIAAAAGA
jgi:hypothetical protein